MKVILKKALCISALFGLSSVAFAQDWSGFYVGPQLSYNWVNTSWLFQEDTFYTGNSPTNQFATNPEGFTVGPHVGWAHQIDSWVLGVEASYNGGSFSDTNVGPLAYAGDTYHTKISKMITATPIIGYTQDQWMFYAKGGYASAKLDVNADSGPPLSGVEMSDSQRQYGWTAGAGISYYLTSKNSLALEYDFTRLNAMTFTTTTTGAGTYSEQVQIQPLNINTVALVYSYHFG